MPRWEARGRLIVPPGRERPRVMGVINVTPDSFSDGGRFSTPELAVARARSLVAEGADLLDLGGESSRPGSTPVSLDEELRRVIPAIEAIVKAVDVPISIDTTRLEVARQAIRSGATIVNDISALTREPNLARLIAETGAGVVLMHMRGRPRTMQVDPHYRDVVAEVHEFLGLRIDAAVAAGIPRERIAIDPGIGFGKTYAHNLELLRKLDRFASLGCALLIGTSRKGLLGNLTGRPVDQRETASIVSSLASVVSGANIVRVHDVGPMVDAIKVWSTLRGWPDPSASSPQSFAVKTDRDSP